MSNARNLANLLGTGSTIATAKIADDAITAAKVADSVFNANRNLIINGAMQVAQRGTSSTGISSAGYRTVDRFSVKENASSIAVTESQSTDTPSGQGFANSLKWEVTTADTSVASAERFHFGQTIEAQNLQHLAYGTSSAKTITLSFWVKSSVTGTYAVSIFKSDQTLRLVNKTYTVNAADTWEKKEITIAGDTSGGGIDNNNGAGFQFDWFLTAGSGSTTASTNEWEAWDGTKWAGGHNVNFGATVGNEYYITGVQLEVGEQGTAFEHRSFGDELARCQRYFQKSYDLGDSIGNTLESAGYNVYQIDDGALQRDGVRLPTRMRTNPTVTIYNPFSGASGSARTNAGNNYSASTFSKGENGFFVSYTPAAGQYVFFHHTADAEL